MLLCDSVNMHTGTSVAGSKKVEETGKDAEGRTDSFSLHIAVIHLSTDPLLPAVRGMILGSKDLCSDPLWTILAFQCSVFACG